VIDLREQLGKLRQQHAKAVIEFGCTCDELMTAEERLDALHQARKLQRANMQGLGIQIQDLAAQVSALPPDPAPGHPMEAPPMESGRSV
jgi:hypothetical protein